MAPRKPTRARAAREAKRKSGSPIARERAAPDPPRRRPPFRRRCSRRTRLVFMSRGTIAYGPSRTARRPDLRMSADPVPSRAAPEETVDLLAELRWRGMLASASPGLEARLAQGPISGYVGFED